MGKIVVLDEITANQIAAGEVVERPVSVVKELVENSLDAGANRITVELTQGGTVGIKVVDNGIGMSAGDAELCFQRHATSKIRLAGDLNNILTLGFRGEALPSIASVARVTLTTRTNEDLAGCVINIEAGKVTERLSTGCPIGTTIEVKDLFFNTPARRKFIKSPNVETGHISDLISRLALAKPKVRFELRSGHKILFYSPGNGSLMDTAGMVFGLDNVKSMLEVDYQGQLLKIQGLISKPVLTRASRQYQNFFINGRYIRSSLIASSLQQAYQTLVPVGRFPIAVLHFSIDPTQVDVNVHPTKMEVRLAREQEIQEEILDALNLALNRPSSITGLWESPVKHGLFQPTTMAKEQDALNLQETNAIAATHNQNQPNNERRNIESKAPKQPTENKVQLKLALPQEEKHSPNVEYAPKVLAQQLNIGVLPSLPKDSIKALESNETSTYEVENIFLSLVPVGQVPPTYALAYGNGGLYIIDQHAAHERVLYEKYLTLLEENEQSQILLHPITLEFPHHEAQVVIRNIVAFNQIGYILEHFGGDTFLLRGVPTHAQADPGVVFFDLLARLQENTELNFEKGLVIDNLAAALACRDAIKAGTHISHSEIKALLEGLGQCKRPYTCPHGRPTLIQISHEEMKKRFKR